MAGAPLDVLRRHLRDASLRFYSSPRGSKEEKTTGAAYRAALRAAIRGGVPREERDAITDAAAEISDSRALFNGPCPGSGKSITPRTMLADFPAGFVLDVRTVETRLGGEYLHLIDVRYEQAEIRAHRDMLLVRQNPDTQVRLDALMGGDPRWADDWESGPVRHLQVVRDDGAWRKSHLLGLAKWLTLDYQARCPDCERPVAMERALRGKKTLVRPKIREHARPGITFPVREGGRG